jgi:hypothetical protein
MQPSPESTSHSFPVRITNKSSSDRTPHPGTPSNNVATTSSKAIKLSVYLYFISHYNLQDGQLEWIAHFQSKLSIAQITKAMKMVHILTTDPRTRARMRISEIKSTLEGKEILLPLWDGKQVPFYRGRPKIREQRRIGVGYRDKGSLSKKPRLDWDKDNTLFLGESQEMVDAQWNLASLFDSFREILNNETAGVVSDKGMTLTSLVQEFLGSQVSLEHPGEKVWCISATKHTFSVRDLLRKL